MKIVFSLSTFAHNLLIDIIRDTHISVTQFWCLIGVDTIIACLLITPFESENREQKPNLINVI